MPDRQKIIDLFAPFYQAFQEETDQLIATFSPSEIETIKTYLLKGIELMKQKTEAFNKQ